MYNPLIIAVLCIAVPVAVLATRRGQGGLPRYDDQGLQTAAMRLEIELERSRQEIPQDAILARFDTLLRHSAAVQPASRVRVRLRRAAWAERIGRGDEARRDLDDARLWLPQPSPLRDSVFVEGALLLARLGDARASTHWRNEAEALGFYDPAMVVTLRRATARAALGRGTPLPELATSASAAAIFTQARQADSALLDLWASWCAPCVAELPRLARLDGQYRHRGLVVLGVACEADAAASASAARQAGVNYPWVNEGLDGPAAEALGLMELPMVLLLERGRVLAVDPPWPAVERLLQQRYAGPDLGH
jgi:thiol-disulfide isomerase/thioredoxin